jgi:hypothetical protein
MPWYYNRTSSPWPRHTTVGAAHCLYQAGNLGQEEKCILTTFLKRTNAIVVLGGMEIGGNDDH